MDRNKLYLHGSPQVWDELFANRDLSYSEKADTQGKLFELVKIHFLERLLSINVRAATSEVAPRTVKTLEVGCGTAFVSLFFAKRGYEVSCLDTSKQILRIAEENFEKEKAQGKFVVGDAEKLPFEDNSFDIVMSFGLLEHFADPKSAISEMVRVLKPGGLFFADIVPARFSVQSLGNIFNALVVFGYWGNKGDWRKGWKKAQANFKPEYYENSLSWQKYKGMMEKAGLEDVQVRGNRPWPRLTLPYSIDHTLYTPILKLSLPLWKLFDNSCGDFSLFWGAGWWFWGVKIGF